MVRLIATERILSALEAIPESSREDLNLPTALDLHGPIAHDQLLRIAKHLQNDTEYNSADCGVSATDPTILSALLRGTKVYVPPPPKKPEPSPEYLASKARLLAAAEKEAYQRLLNPTYKPNIESTDPYTNGQNEVIAEDTLTPSLVLNIFLSVIITGFAVYWALYSFGMPGILASIFTALTGPPVGLEGDLRAARDAVGASDAVRVLLSLIAALSVAVAESFLYALYLGKVEKARKQERAVKEEKVVIGPVDEDQNEQTDARPVESVISEKEEIWGKGVNGGVRRRVREKWEKEQNAQSTSKES